MKCYFQVKIMHCAFRRVHLQVFCSHVFKNGWMAFTVKEKPARCSHTSAPQGRFSLALYEVFWQVEKWLFAVRSTSRMENSSKPNRNIPEWPKYCWHRLFSHEDETRSPVLISAAESALAWMSGEQCRAEECRILICCSASVMGFPSMQTAICSKSHYCMLQRPWKAASVQHSVPLRRTTVDTIFHSYSDRPIQWPVPILMWVNSAIVSTRSRRIKTIHSSG